MLLNTFNLWFAPRYKSFYLDSFELSFDYFCELIIAIYLIVVQLVTCNTAVFTVYYLSFTTFIDKD